MTPKKLMKNIGYGKDALGTFARFSFLEREYEADKARYYADEEGFYRWAKKRFDSDYYCALLYYFTRFAADLYEEYAMKGFSRQVYFDTFSDLRIWNEMCVEETGICGLKETCWLTSHMHAQIVRLGRLQFQYAEAEEKIDTGGITVAKGEKVYNVHIPWGDPLTADKVSNSFEEAQNAFGKGVVYHLESWLLDPTLEEFLSEGSNILRFQKEFTLYKTEVSDAIERFVFRVVKKNKNEYVASTSFAEKIKAALLNGKSFFVGFGVKKI